MPYCHEDHTGRETRFLIVADLDPGERGGIYTPPVMPSIEIVELQVTRYGVWEGSDVRLADRVFLSRVLLNKLDESDLQERVNEYLSEY